MSELLFWVTGFTAGAASTTFLGALSVVLRARRLPEDEA